MNGRSAVEGERVPLRDQSSAIYLAADRQAIFLAEGWFQRGRFDKAFDKAKLHWSEHVRDLATDEGRDVLRHAIRPREEAIALLAFRRDPG